MTDLEIEIREIEEILNKVQEYIDRVENNFNEFKEILKNIPEDMKSSFR